LTLHRPANVDDPATFAPLFAALARIAQRLPLVFPVHPRTCKSLAAIGAETTPGVILTDPLGYLDFMKLTAHARMVLTDSGGIQEETTVLGVPCLTLRANTERPITCTEGTNQLVGLDPTSIESAALATLGTPRDTTPIPALWDGSAAKRIVDVLAG
jgi:UDP-N-acetylglucosamine 2-epimerase (non-hydrolysing)